MVCLRDPLNYATQTLILPYPAFFVASLFDGRRSILDIQEAFARHFGQIVFSDDIREIARRLDEHYYLESERFAARQRELAEAFRRSPLRRMAHADTCYPARAEDLKGQLESFFTAPAGPGLPASQPPPERPVRGIIAPHIDLRVGGPCYAWAYKEVAERSDADLFVLLGTSHFGGEQLFTATTKDYDTPLGPVRTDRDFLAELSRRYRGDLFADEVLHRNEHSLEFQALFLRFAVPDGRREFTAVPILVSSFHEMVAAGIEPVWDARVADFVAALRATIEASGRRVCLVAGVDFAHVGRKFGDPGPLGKDLLEWVEREDRRLIAALERIEPEAFFDEIAKDGDRRRICGFPAMYTFLRAVRAAEGKLLMYDRSVEAATESSVSFASLAFY
jgi:hypothetical protein